MRKILGISAFYHDAAAAVIVDGEIKAAAQEERFSRIKHTAEFPLRSVRYCLEEAGLSIRELDAIVFYDKPLLKFERLLETYYAFSPKGLKSFLTAIPVWVRDKLFLKKLIYDELGKIEKVRRKDVNLLFPEHHISHAASAFFASPYEEAAILTMDGVGEWATACIGFGKGNQISTLKELHFPHSVGLLYSAFTYYLGFKVNSGEYKLMGLAPYGVESVDETRHFIDAIKTQLVDIKEDGSIWLNQKWFTYATELRMVDDKKWEELFGIPRRKPEGELNQSHCNLALAIQKVTEEIVLKMAKEAKKLTGLDNLCMAGGVALNCVANGKLYRSKLYKQIYIQPAAGDAGGALGAALAAHYIFFGEERKPEFPDSMKSTYLGPDYSDQYIERQFRKHKAIFKKITNYEDLAAVAAKELAGGKVVGWFQGRMEFGPRALGNRSILGDARNPEMQNIINQKIKQREEFRPFAPAVLAEDAQDYFEFNTESPYMLFTAPVLIKRRKGIPGNFETLAMIDKLNFEKSDIPSVTHVDFSVRLQTVSKETNIRFWNLLDAFKSLTDCSVLINTSFNVRGEPIVCTPADAYRCFMSTEMDVLVINNYILFKQNQQKTHV